jgi:hypothetical protein
MKFILSWLKDHFYIDASLETISEPLTKIGLEVEHPAAKQRGQQAPGARQPEFQSRSSLGSGHC